MRMKFLAGALLLVAVLACDGGLSPSDPDESVGLTTQEPGTIDGKTVVRYENGLDISVTDVAVADQVSHLPKALPEGESLVVATMLVKNDTDKPFDATKVSTSLRAGPDDATRQDYFEAAPFDAVIQPGQSASGRTSFKMSKSEFGEITISVTPFPDGSWDIATFVGTITND